MCAFLALTGLAAIWLLTGGLQFWTYDSLRRELAQQGNLVAEPIELQLASGHFEHPWSGNGAPTTYVMDFIYTRCESICNVLGTEFQQMQRKLQQEPSSRLAGVQLLSVSFDRRDKAADLARYARQYGAVEGIWNIAAASDPAALRALLRQLGVVVVSDGRGDFVHNGALSVVDGTGRMRAVFAYAQWEQALRCAQAVARGTTCAP